MVGSSRKSFGVFCLITVFRRPFAYTSNRHLLPLSVASVIVDRCVDSRYVLLDP